MLKRVTWFLSGAVAGAAGVGYAKRTIRRSAARLAPASVARSAAAKVRRKRSDVVEAVREGRQAMRAKESELRDHLDGDLITPRSQADAESTGLVDGDQLLSDGPVAEQGRAIAVRQVHDDAHVSVRRRRRRIRRGT